MYERLYGTAATISFPVIAFSTSSFHNSLTTTLFAAGDFKISLNYADFTNTATLPSVTPGGRSIVLSLTSAEMSAAHIELMIVDQTSPKVWEDQAVVIETYGTTSAQHGFNRNQTTVQASLTAAQTGVTIANVTAVTNTVTAHVTSFAANAISAAAIADSAIDAATIASDAKSRILKNTALSNFMFLMVDSTDHVTSKTGLTITATRSIDGAAFASCANSATEVSAGIYKINLDAADLNGDVITLRFSGTAADDRFITIVTQTA